MRPTRMLSLGVFVALLIASLAVPALAQDDPELCDEYPIGECVDEPDENGTPTVPGDEDETDISLTRTAQPPSTTLPITGTNALLMLIAGLVLVLSGATALVLMRRRGTPTA